MLSRSLLSYINFLCRYPPFCYLINLPCHLLKFPGEKQAANNVTPPWDLTRQATVIMLHNRPPKSSEFAMLTIYFMVKGIHFGCILTDLVLFLPELYWTMLDFRFGVRFKSLPHGFNFWIYAAGAIAIWNMFSLWQRVEAPGEPEETWNISLKLSL